MKTRQYDGYNKDNNKYYVLNQNKNRIGTIESGVYRLDFDHDMRVPYIYESELKNDNILDLPSDEYQEILRTMNRFLLPEIKDGYKELGFLYKRNILMYGSPGTGKTILVNKITNSAVKDQKAVCIFVDSDTAEGNVPGLTVLQNVLKWFEDTNPDTLLVLIIEEMDEMIEKHEHMLLLLLDGQMQRPNTIVLGTTNFIDNIPARFLRPGRFSQTIEVKLPCANARRHYLMHKLGKDFKNLDLWTKETDGFTIDDLKEVIQSSYLIGEPFEKVIGRLKHTKNLLTERDFKTT